MKESGNVPASATTFCPNRDQLQELLDGALPPGEQDRLTGHLDGCARCQLALERLAGSTSPWVGSSPVLDATSTPAEAALRQVIEELKGDQIGRDTKVDADDAEITLDFLDPPAFPQQLGRLGPYEVIEVIGRGGMGVVLKGFDPTLNRLVALKVLAPQLATNPAARLRFAREAQAGAAVRHENVVAVHDVDEVHGLPYLVMEFVPGISLQDYVRRDRPPPLATILHLVIQIADALAATHEQGLIHRDVKPANILIQGEETTKNTKEETNKEEGNTKDRGPEDSSSFRVFRVFRGSSSLTPKLTDFGLARAVDDVSLTRTGFIAGTPQYMAPEQVRGEKLDQRADLFSLGGVLYFLCTGQPPFRADNTMAVMRQVCEEAPPPIRSLNREIPGWLSDIVAKLMAKVPARRFAAARRVAELLRQHQEHLQRPGEVPPPEIEADEPIDTHLIPAQRRLNWTLVAIILLACAALGTIAAVAVGVIVGQLVPVSPKQMARTSTPDTVNPKAEAPNEAPPELVNEPARAPKEPPPQPPDDAEVDKLLNDLRANPSQRLAVARKLAKLPPNEKRRAEVAEALQSLLKDSNLFTRSTAAEALGVWGSKESAPLLVELLADEQHSVRWATLAALGKLKDDRVAGQMARRLEKDGSFATQALQQLGPAAERAVLPYLKHENPSVRLEACRVLKVIGTGESKADLLNATRQGEVSYVVGAAAEALKAINAREGK